MMAFDAGSVSFLTFAVLIDFIRFAVSAYMKALDLSGVSLQCHSFRPHCIRN